MTVVWTCPFCPLLCDDLSVQLGPPDDALELVGGDCPRARAALQGFGSRPAGPGCTVNGKVSGLDEAIVTAARLLARSRQPLFAGLGTDVAGARALYRLACDTGAICDAADGAALMRIQRVLQDHGGFSTTFAEVRTRADLVVFIGRAQMQSAPRLWQRCGLGDDVVPDRRAVLLGASDDEAAALRAAAPINVDAVPLHGDLFDTVALLGALVAGRSAREAPEALSNLARELRAARYATFIGAAAELPEHGALIVEGLHRLVGELNRSTRAAVLWVGGGDGAGTVNQAFTWLSGLPLRSRAGPQGIEHEPLCFDTTRLMADGAVDAMLWVSSFDADALPPATTLPRILLGPPAVAPKAGQGGEADVVFIPVSTPGIGSGGHLFRTDGSVVLPLFAARPDALPGVAEVVARLGAALVSARAGATS